MVAGFTCPICKKPTAKEVRNSNGNVDIVARYRVCTCGRSVATVEITRTEHQQLIRLRNQINSGK